MIAFEDDHCGKGARYTRKPSNTSLVPHAAVRVGALPRGAAMTDEVPTVSSMQQSAKIGRKAHESDAASASRTSSTPTGFLPLDDLPSMDDDDAEHLVGEIAASQPPSDSAGGHSMAATNDDYSASSVHLIHQMQTAMPPDESDAHHVPAATNAQPIFATDGLFALLDAVERLHVKADAQTKQLNAQTKQLDAQAKQLDQMRILMKAQKDELKKSERATPEYTVVSDSDDDSQADDAQADASQLSTELGKSGWSLDTPTFYVKKPVQMPANPPTTEWNGREAQPPEMLAEHISLWALGESEFTSSLFEYCFQYGTGSWFSDMHNIFNEHPQHFANDRMMITFQSRDMLQMIANFGRNDPKGKQLLAFGLPDNIGATFRDTYLEEGLESIKSYLVHNILQVFCYLYKAGITTTQKGYQPRATRQPLSEAAFDKAGLELAHDRCEPICSIAEHKALVDLQARRRKRRN